MPKRSKHPRLRVHIKRGKAGQAWTSYWFDNRGTGQPDAPLGTDYDAALLRWAELRQGALRITGTVEEALRRYERDVLTLRLSDVRGGKLVVTAAKTGKRAEFALDASAVLPAIIARRRLSRSLHIYLLDAGRVVTERMLHDRFIVARAKAAQEAPEVTGLYLRDIRKFAAQLAPDTASAAALLQHSSEAVTRRHYAPTAKLRPVR